MEGEVLGPKKQPHLLDKTTPQLVDGGAKCLMKGYSFEACTLLERARANAILYEEDESLIASSTHWLAMAYAARGEIDKAAQLFEQAVDVSRYALNKEDHAVVLRDHGGFLLRLGKIDEATERVEESISNLPQNSLEWQVSKGFFGRIHLLDGLHCDQGKRELKLTHDVLSAKHAPLEYQLDNLMWLLRALNPQYRPFYALRALTLALRVNPGLIVDIIVRSAGGGDRLQAIVSYVMRPA